MNRQLKRANEKSDKRREREQERRKQQRRQSRVRVTKAKTASRESVKDSAKDGAKDGAPERSARPAPGTRRPGLAGAYLLLVIGVIAAQALVPQQTDVLSLVVHTLFYVILGYFLSLWLYRRGVARALIWTLAGGVLLAFGVEALKLVLPQLGPPEAGTTEPNLLFTALALPGLVLGAWLGRFIFRRSA